jgi:hypothetical protein
MIVPAIEIQKRLELLRTRFSSAVWEKNQGVARISRELINSLSAKFFSNCEV